jgi:hypothetical protein
VLLMLALVFASATQEFHLVREDYYAAEMVYESHLQKTRNTENLSSRVEVWYEADQEKIGIRLPADIKRSSGSLLLYYPTSARKDREISWDPTTETELLFDAKALASGLCRVKLDWVSEGIPYFSEHMLYLP